MSNYFLAFLASLSCNVAFPVHILEHVLRDFVRWLRTGRRTERDCETGDDPSDLELDMLYQRKRDLPGIPNVEGGTNTSNDPIINSEFQLLTCDQLGSSDRREARSEIVVETPSLNWNHSHCYPQFVCSTAGTPDVVTEATHRAGETGEELGCIQWNIHLLDPAQPIHLIQEHEASLRCDSETCAPVITERPNPYWDRQQGYVAIDSSENEEGRTLEGSRSEEDASGNTKTLSYMTLCKQEEVSGDVKKVDSGQGGGSGRLPLSVKFPNVDKELEDKADASVAIGPRGQNISSTLESELCGASAETWDQLTEESGSSPVESEIVLFEDKEALEALQSDVDNIKAILFSLAAQLYTSNEGTGIDDCSIQEQIDFSRFMEEVGKASSRVSEESEDSVEVDDEKDFGPRPELEYLKIYSSMLDELHSIRDGLELLELVIQTKESEQIPGMTDFELPQ